ncbi:TPA: hypothetical protein QC311_002250 [Bacillus cereus]|nr:hypothetical protein [Bacillus cereus]HDR8461411.1 hypothetical protein [Bacillus cereus]
MENRKKIDEEAGYANYEEGAQGIGKDLKNKQWILCIQKVTHTKKHISDPLSEHAFFRGAMMYSKMVMLMALLVYARIANMLLIYSNECRNFILCVFANKRTLPFPARYV